MDLRDYLFRYKVTQKDFAKRLGVSTNTLFNIIHGNYNPRLPLAINIVRLSGQRVDIASLVIEKDRDQLLDI